MNNELNSQTEDNRLIVTIKEEQLTVAPEGEVKVHVAIINKNLEEDEYLDIQVKGIPPDWTTIDNPVVRVGAGKMEQVTLTIQPPPIPQSRVGQYPLDLRAISQNDPTRWVTARSTLTVAAYESRGWIGVMLGSVQFSIAPGSNIHIPILLQNRGKEEDSFRLNVKGIPANWISTNSAFTQLNAGESKEIQLTIRTPHSPEADAGRAPFTIQFISQNYPEQMTEVDCILTVAAFSKFSASLQPELMQSGQMGNLVINNEGNTVNTYNLTFNSPGSMLIFEKGVPVSKSTTSTGAQQVEVKYVEIPPEEKIQVKAGEQGIYTFRSKLRSRPIVGEEQTYPFSIKATSSDHRSIELPGEVSERGLLPTRLISVGVIGLIILCIIAFLPFNSIRNSTAATQTAIFEQTQAALSGQEDSDGDGLINNTEISIGTDILKADTDGDKLLDGDEVNVYTTNPLLPDTDEDGVLDGEEILVQHSDPLNPDTDQDGLSDGDEIKYRTVPVDPDTDRDGLNDGDEVAWGTDPRRQDTDGDSLLDGQENQTCPRPLEPDSDNDGIIDGIDLDPCNASNPSLTATAVISAPTSVTVVPPTSIVSSTPVPTVPAVASATPPAIPGLQGIMVFESNRDGNSEIYALNFSSQSMLRVTNDLASDTQPALAPDSLRIAYVSNRNGNNEIYIGGLDRRAAVNITNNAADDQQPAWSSDGNWITFTSNRDGNQEVYVMRSDGTELHNLSNDPANDFAPTWYSVNHLLGSEEWIAFTSTRDGNQEIYRIRPDGSGLENLTQNPANDYSPSGAQDGLLIAFVSDRGGNPEIYSMTDTGGAPNNVTNHFSQDIEPTIGASEDWIIFSTNRDGNLEVYAIDMNGGTAYNLTNNPADDRNPDW